MFFKLFFSFFKLDTSTAIRGLTGQCSTSINGPWYVKSTTTCNDVGGVHMRTVVDCRAAALKYGLADTTPMVMHNTNQTSGCYFNTNTQELYFNTNMDSTVVCGEYSATCLCYVGAACSDLWGHSVSTGPKCECGNSLCSAETGLFCFERSNSCITRRSLEATGADFLRFRSAIGQQ